ncbi:hypothetical protein BT96DRAFT_914802 [Gymnopus androsaceus JB14]|uniref:Uncharacterized protein n=1 Tax=Gymnopus androsaceus JB14 TaxID=1447944 RepID=A0A6A4IEY7_9AGAR|nr:hypothetical protein BT96DRAFT_914802 [Gymnopus androsaceus JB14]
MPPKSEPKIYHIIIRTHKSSIFCTVPPSTTIASLKEEALSALSSDLNQEEGIPKVTVVDDFELCRLVKAKQTKEYHILETESSIKALKLGVWETLYIQFKDSQGEPLPIVAVDPPIDDDEDAPSEPPAIQSSPVNKGKRKANDIEGED